MNQRITILERSSGEWDWTTEQSKLSAKFEIVGHSKHPTFTLVMAEVSASEVYALIGHNDFTLEVVEGRTNPKLPFTPG